MPPCLDIISPRLTAAATVLSISRRTTQTCQPTSYGKIMPSSPDILAEVTTGMLADTLGYGLADSNRSFVLYFTSKQQRYNQVMVYFGQQGRLLLSLSIGYEAAGHFNQLLVEALLNQLCADYRTEVGIYGVELAPADAEERLYPLLP